MYADKIGQESESTSQHSGFIGNARKRSLAHDLRARRELQDHFSHERNLNQNELMSALSELENESPLMALHGGRRGVDNSSMAGASHQASYKNLAVMQRMRQ